MPFQMLKNISSILLSMFYMPLTHTWSVLGKLWLLMVSRNLARSIHILLLSLMLHEYLVYLPYLQSMLFCTLLHLLMRLSTELFNLLGYLFQKSLFNFSVFLSLYSIPLSYLALSFLFYSDVYLYYLWINLKVYSNPFFRWSIIIIILFNSLGF